MIGYYFRLAFASFRRTPGLGILMVLAIAVGIGVCVVTHHLLPRAVGQSDLVEERSALRRDARQLGPDGARGSGAPHPSAGPAHLQRRGNHLALGYSEAHDDHVSRLRHHLR